MTEHERKLTRLDLNKIQSDGRYVDFEHSNMFRLSYEDVMFLRMFYHDKNIASSYEFSNIQPLTGANLRPRSNQKARPKQQRRPVSKSAAVATQQPTKKKSSRPKYQLTREQKYTNNKHKGINFNGKKLAAAVLVIVMSLSIIKAMSKEGTPINIPQNPSYGVTDTYTPNDVAGIPETTISLNDDIEDDIKDNVQSERAIINQLANIYQINPDKAYEIIASLTNNFSSASYKNDFTIKDVSCKGSGQLYCGSEEEVLAYTMRILKQDPERFGYKYNNIKMDNGYETPANKQSYIEVIGHYSELFDVDPALVYGIMKAETGFDSELLNGINNPAGLKNIDGTWWKFDTKEEGIIELILQVKAYLAKGAVTVEDIAAIHCPINDPDDIHKINQYWVGNVKDGMAEGREIYKNMQFESGTNRL